MLLSLRHQLLSRSLRNLLWHLSLLLLSLRHQLLLLLSLRHQLLSRSLRNLLLPLSLWHPLSRFLWPNPAR